VSSKPTPSAAGVHCSITIPFGTYMTPKRAVGLALVFCRAVSAGTIPSRRGSANVAPIPRNIVRRGIARLVMIMCLAPISERQS
jgi:hypothetical protein